MKAVSLILLLLFTFPAALAGQDCDPVVIQVETQSGQTISLVQVGAVDLQDAASELYALEAVASAETNIFSGPGPSYDEVGRLSNGDSVLVHASNCTHHWLRTVLDDGQAGWIAARDVVLTGDIATLPLASVYTPVYASMQAFTLQPGTGTNVCAADGELGVLIQASTAADPVPLQVNGVPMMVSGTVFVQANADGEQTVEVLSGETQITVGSMTARVDDGMRALIVEDALHVEPYVLADVELLPVSVLPESVDVADALTDNAPRIVGLEPCRVISNSTDSVCPLHFVNRDGDAIVRVEIEFVSAPQGEWSSSIDDAPIILEGDQVSGALAWTPTCSLGASCFIGPVIWSITLTDAAGNVSEPFEASLNCVDV